MLILDGGTAGDLDAGCRREWLETNGLGSFAMGTVAGPGTRRYHAFLCAAANPPVGRLVLVNRTEEWVLVDGVRHALTSHFYPDVVHPDGHRALVEFRLDPWPTWRWRVGGALVERSLFMPHGRQLTVVTWRLVPDEPGGARARLFVRPLISGRDYHALHHENSALRTDAAVDEGHVRFAPYESVPVIHAHHNGVYHHRPEWYRRFEYPLERARGLDWEEDLFSPGELAFELAGEAQAVVVFGLESETPDVARLADGERARRAALVAGVEDPFTAGLTAAADQFVVARSEHRSVIAGYPWFTDWGRDAFIALGALPEVAGDLLAAFAPFVDGGLLPNRFADTGPPEYNAADAPLWFVLASVRHARRTADRRCAQAVRQIIDGYLGGTRFHIGVDDDGLIHADAAGLQLTWMDAKIGDWVVTPRRGKPVEIQALWVAALEAAARLFADEDAIYAHELTERAAWARSSFAALFWDESLGWMYDVVDGPRRDATLRPNQLYALGLCRPLVDGARAERALQACERELLTRVGLRSRARGPGYLGRYDGDPRARDAAYHEGTVWPFLYGIYADACMRVRGRLPDDLLSGLRTHAGGVGLGTICEIFDGDAPHEPRGCPSQAWSVAEVLRILRGDVGKDA
jgi:predicted glycogen debranching enzyme